MTSCDGKAGLKRLVSIKNERPAAAPRRAPSASVAAFPVSAIALAVALFAASPQMARAANECGVEAAGQDTLTCSGTSYLSGITYTLSNGLTLNLDNPNMVISGKGVSLSSPVGPVGATLHVNMANIGSITTTGSAVSVDHNGTDGHAAVTINGGTLTSTGSAATVLVQGGGTNRTDALVTMNGGTVLNTGSGVGLSATASGVNSNVIAAVVINGGTVDTINTGVYTTMSGLNNSGASSITMNGGSVLSRGGIGLWARHGSVGLAQVQMTGGRVESKGINGDAILASNTNGTYAVEVTGGTLIGSSGFGAAIHTAAKAGGTVNIGAGAVVDGSASGVALRDGDLVRDGIDEVGGNAIITTAGTLTGAVLLGGGTDTLNIAGGSIAGNLTGDGVDALNFNLGTNSFTHGAAYAISGMNSVTMNSGTAQIDSTMAGNTLTVNGGAMTLSGANSYTGGTFLNGGVLSVSSDANLGDAAGALSFDGGTLRTSADFASARAVSLGAGGGTFQADANLALSSGITGAGGLTKTGAGTLTLSGANSFTGSTTISAGTLALAGAGSLADSSQVIANGTFDIAGVSAAGTSVRRLSGSGAVTLAGKTLTLTAAQDTFSGAIAGSGSFVLAAGTQVLTGTNTYTGGTTINGASTLQLGSGGTSGSVAGNVVNDGTFVFNRANRLDLGGDISGSGVIRQIGTGMTNLTGNSAAFAGATTVEAGTLAVNGALGGSMNVLAAGRLQGSGSVGGTTVAGTVAPGNSIGTLSVNGNFAQQAGSTYQVEVDPASTASDLLRVSGSASIASGARLQVVRTGNGSFGIGTRYTVLSADGGVIGTYNLTGDTESAFVRVTDSYDANHVYLLAQKTRSFTEPATTPNQVAVGGALESLPGANPLSTAVAWLPNDFAARDALNQLSADIHASSKTAALEDSRFVREAAIDRLRSAACAPGSAAPTPQQAGTACTPEDGQARSSWGQVFGSWGRIDSDGNAAKLKRDIGGFFVGADTGIGAGWRVGALGGYSRASADTSTSNSSSKTDSYHLGVYGGTQWGATALRLGASHSWSKTDTSRSAAFAGFNDTLTGKYDSTTTQVFGEVGHRLAMGSATLEPFAGLAHVTLKSDAFMEHGGFAALYGHGGSIDATFSTLGVRASMQASESMKLRGMLGWRHAFGDTVPTSTHSFGGSLPFTIAGVPLAKNVAVLEAGVETQLRPNLALSASYSGQFGDGLSDHGFKVNLNWAF
ncbi:outer membrane autotransporter protein [Variovorax paradoxus]|uniref:Outer membrane autotransporter protein n=1 Tax=Variovorax paradoxus TaxID=34073 RepID=A0AAW8EG40_VARPD|nr:autotransporter domain-containing protein [Variovorax paradoxus]MDP9971757.1 outer membrane autotransporter protein [Variovorax paradoxus]